MVPNEQAIRALFSEALEDKRLLDELLTHPSDTLSKISVAIPIDSELEFHDFILACYNKGQLASTQNWPTMRCSACTVSVWGIAAGIVALGVAGLTTITVASPVVIALSSWAGVSAAAAHAFIISLGTAIGGGIAKVAEHICKWVGLCP